MGIAITLFLNFFMSLNNTVSNNLSFLPLYAEFIMLKCVKNCGPKQPPKRVPWARCQKIFKFTYTYKFFLKTKQKKFTIEPKSYPAMLLYLFLILYCLLTKKKWNLKNDPRLPTLPLNTI